LIKFEGETCEEQLEYAEQLVARYKYDSMTGLKGRIDFDEAFERMVDSRVYDGRSFTFALADINGLKQINDNYGYLAGDELIKKVARDLVQAFDKTVTIYRFGGDEFAILCTNISRIRAKNAFSKIHDSHNFSYGVIDSEEVDWKNHDCKSIFNFVNALLHDAKADFKESKRLKKEQA